MRTSWRSMLLMVLALLSPSLALTQEASSGLASTRHDAVIRGVVTSANAKPLKKAHVTLTNLLTDEKKETQTDKSGRFLFSQLFSGKYRLEVAAKGGETATDEISLGDGETITRKLAAKRRE